MAVVEISTSAVLLQDLFRGCTLRPLVVLYPDLYHDDDDDDDDEWDGVVGSDDGYHDDDVVVGDGGDGEVE